MDFLHRIRAFAAVLTCTGFINVHADSDLAPAQSDADWQTRRLMTPTPSELAAESNGQIYIYDSLEINQVETVIDQHFGRIQNTMFTRIHRLSPTGDGTAVVEDDGCE